MIDTAGGKPAVTGFMIRIVVDANIIISALLAGSARFVLFDSRFEFVTAEFTLGEVIRYLPTIAEKTNVSFSELNQALSLLPIVIYAREYYSRELFKARKMLREIDPDDADLLALYFTEGVYLWSEDKDFEKIVPSIRLLKTKDFF